MNEAFVSPDERERTVLRDAIADLTLRIASFGGDTTRDDQALRTFEMEASWQRLVLLIQPEPEPLRRPCPHCQGRIMHQATRCLYCLQRSAPPASEAH